MASIHRNHFLNIFKVIFQNPLYYTNYEVYHVRKILVFQTFLSHTQEYFVYLLFYILKMEFHNLLIVHEH